MGAHKDCSSMSILQKAGNRARGLRKAQAHFMRNTLVQVPDPLDLDAPELVAGKQNLDVAQNDVSKRHALAAKG